MSEKFPGAFDPADKKYKTVEDLPKEEQDRFMNVKDGFVGDSAVNSFARDERIASSLNELRPLIEKLTGQNKEHAIDLQHERSIEDDRSGNTKDKYAEHSRETYQEVLDAKEGVLNRSQAGSAIGGGMMMGRVMETRGRMLMGAERRLKELENQGFEEATALNGEYSRLKDAAERADKDLEVFMTERLGMKANDSE